MIDLCKADWGSGHENLGLPFAIARSIRPSALNLLLVPTVLRTLEQRFLFPPPQPPAGAGLRQPFPLQRAQAPSALAVGSTSSIKVIGRSMQSAEICRFPASRYAHQRGHNSAAPRRLRPAAYYSSGRGCASEPLAWLQCRRPRRNAFRNRRSFGKSPMYGARSSIPRRSE